MAKRVLYWVIILSLAACGGSDGTGGNGQSAPQPIDPASLNDPTLLGEGAYALGASGAVEFSVSSSDIRVLSLSNPTGLDQRAIEMGEGSNSYIFRIGFSGQPQSGTYSFSSWGSEAGQEGIYSAGLFYLLSPDSERQFISNPQGTLNLTVDGDLLTATFEVVLQNENNSASVAVRGAFHNILNRPVGD